MSIGLLPSFITWLTASLLSLSLILFLVPTTLPLPPIPLFAHLSPPPHCFCLCLSFVVVVVAFTSRRRRLSRAQQIKMLLFQSSGDSPGEISPRRLGATKSRKHPAPLKTPLFTPFNTSIVHAQVFQKSNFGEITEFDWNNEESIYQ